jgi:DNA-binding transcriptional ArsR family regulator
MKRADSTVATTQEVSSSMSELATLLNAPSVEDIEKIVSAWTRRAAEEAASLLAPVSELARRGEIEAALAAMQVLLTEQALEIQRLKMLDRLAKRLRFGGTSEKLSAEELGQAYLAFGGEPGADGTIPEQPVVPTPDIAATELEEPSAELAAEGGDGKPERSKPHGGGGRRPLPADLLRIETL